ncbi:ABC transporter permease [Miniphocaeibacter halophilus]|uniref:ABC transporter permease n=1 Tax=Miniphocaeibacter halophilus TaxID=2931922 RepID=A0AC61MP23_9FIRM|nr:ABC transporter permease [Miniphocaeibacter halophilus]QQK07221.1 ABC transporter permease [Miniphocaeibacter halophilus]
MKVLRRFFLKIFGDEKRQAITIPIFSILLSLVAGAIILAVLGKNPFSALYNLLRGSGLAPKLRYAGSKGMITDFASFLNSLTPMIFGALAVAVALKGGLFNIGVSGQMLASGFIATIVIGYSGLNAYIAKPLVIIIGIVVGGLVGGLIGFLKYKFNINEVVASIMINYIVQYTTSFFINTRYIDPVSRQSVAVSSESRLTLMNTQVGNYRMDIPLGIILAIVVVFVIKFLIDKTNLGFEIKAVGSSRSGAKYIGIPVGSRIVTVMVISGALAGLAGVTYFLGYFGSIQPKVLPSLGFDAIAVALLGNSNPIGIIFSSFVINIISEGSAYMSSQAGIEQEISSVITGIILLFSACGAYIKYRLSKSKDKLEEEKKEVKNNG